MVNPRVWLALATTAAPLGAQASFLADLIAVPGDPLTDPSLLERVSFVLKSGVVVKQ